MEGAALRPGCPRSDLSGKEGAGDGAGKENDLKPTNLGKLRQNDTLGVNFWKGCANDLQWEQEKSEKGS